MKKCLLFGSLILFLAAFSFAQEEHAVGGVSRAKRKFIRRGGRPESLTKKPRKFLKMLRRQTALKNFQCVSGSKEKNYIHRSDRLHGRGF